MHINRRFGTTYTTVKAIRWLSLFGIAVSLSVLAIGLSVMLQARAEAWRQARQIANNVTLTLERDIARNIAVYDLSLRGAAEVLGIPGLDQLPAALRHAAIFDRAASAQDLGAMLVMDANGTITATSSTETIQQAVLTDRDYFIVHRDHPDAGLFVSQPFYSRMRHGEPTLVLSRRLTARDGSFEGIVVGALNTAFFDHLFAKLDVGSGGVVSLIHTDGHLIARLPSSKDTLGFDLRGSGTFNRIIADKTGDYVAKGAVDGVTRLYSFRRVGDLPLVISVGLSIADINASWFHRSVIIGGLLGLLCLATLTLSVLFRREMLKRLKAEAMLAQRAENLAVLATTDGLTGLNNRLAFQGELNRAWRHALLSKSTIAVLMLDADFFKSYNDQYGHLAGDRVLCSIASCIVANIHRPLDFAARYGGEEFVILLPETGLEGATSVAEAIRCSVMQLGIPHDANPTGVVTVSIGVASTYAAQLDVEQQLLREADEALSETKENGRHRVTAAGTVAQSLGRQREVV